MTIHRPSVYLCLSSNGHRLLTLAPDRQLHTILGFDAFEAAAHLARRFGGQVQTGYADHLAQATAERIQMTIAGTTMRPDLATNASWRHGYWMVHSLDHGAQPRRPRPHGAKVTVAFSRFPEQVAIH